MNSLTKVVLDEKQAAFLTSTENLVYLEPFMGRSCSVSEAAAQANVKAQQMFYRVTQMGQLGLVEQVAEEKRHGKKVKLFRASSEAYFVPLVISPLQNLAAFFQSVSTVMLEEQCLFQAKTLLRNKADCDYGFRIEKIGSDVNFNLTPLDVEAKPSNNRSREHAWAPELPMVMGFGRFRISQKKAEALRQLLRQLDEVEEDEVGEYYIYRIALAPEVE